MNEHIYATLYKNEIIFLDLLLDKYFILQDNTASLFLAIFDLEIKTKEKLNDLDLHQLIGYLQKQKIISASLFDSKQEGHFFINQHAKGAQQIDWNLNSAKEKISLFNVNVWVALLQLIKTHRLLKKNGLARLIQDIKLKSKKMCKNKKPSQMDVHRIHDLLNKACFLYPKKTRCLAWSITFTLLALKSGWSCNLVIGVQNYPFLAHAWVEYDNKVIGDDADLSTKMAIMLREPFH